MSGLVGFATLERGGFFGDSTRTLSCARGTKTVDELGTLPKVGPNFSRG